MELKDLYRDVILDHNKRPRNFGQIEAADAAGHTVVTPVGFRVVAAKPR